MWKRASILSIILSLLPSISTSQTALDNFLDHVEAASSQPSCEETEQALAGISEAEFDMAYREMKLLHHESDVYRYGDKLKRIGQLTGRCPSIQDKFAGRLSLFAVHSQINGHRGDFSSIERFVEWCERAIVEDCALSAQKLKQFPSGMCSEAVIGFQTVNPMQVSDEAYKQVSTKMEKILNWSSRCAAYKHVYESCLRHDEKEYRNLSELEPFFVYLQDLKRRIESSICQDMSQFKDDIELRHEASKALAGLKPSEFSPSDREKIRALMDEIYHVSEQCPAARTVIDKAIENLF